jgi:hypothetical protein
MAKRDERISMYVTEDRKLDLERRADAEDLPLSKYLNRLIDRQMQMEAENEISAQTRATERLQRLVDEGQRELRDVSDDIRDMNAKMGAYAIAAFELQARHHEQAEIRDALATGAQRLREDHDPQEAAETAAAEAAVERPESDADDDGDPGDPFAHRRE